MTLPSQGFFSRNKFLAHPEAAQRVWNPGHYVSFPGWLAVLSGGAVNASASAVYNIITAKPAIKGVEIVVIWSDLETSYGVYDDSLIDAHVARCATEGLQLCVRVSHKTFSNSDHAVPAYMQAGANDTLYGNDDGGGTGNSSGGEYQTSANGYVVKLNISACYTRFLALVTHLADRYDSNPNLEMFYFNESAQGTPLNYTQTATVTTNFYTNLNSLGAITKDISQFKVIAQLFNFSNNLAATYAAVKAAGVGIAHPDTFTSTTIGETSNTDPVNHNIALAGAAAAFNGASAYDRSYTYSTDARNNIPIIALVSPDSWDHDRPHTGTPATFYNPATATELHTWCRDQLYATHVFWYYVNATPATYGAVTAYDYRDLVLSGGIVYQSKTPGTDTNTGNAVGNTTYWANLGDTFPAMDKQFYPLMDTLAALEAGGLNATYPSLL